MTITNQQTEGTAMTHQYHDPNEITVPSLIGKRVLIRSGQSGVHFGTLAAQDRDAVTLTESRRVRYWVGATSCTELSLRGPQDGSQITETLPRIDVFGVHEIIPMSSVADGALSLIADWTMEAVNA